MSGGPKEGGGWGRFEAFEIPNVPGRKYGSVVLSLPLLMGRRWWVGRRERFASYEVRLLAFLD
eukprot:1065799-Pyramimonas_sp.AAC.1